MLKHHLELYQPIKLSAKELYNQFDDSEYNKIAIKCRSGTKLAKGF